VLFDNVLVPNSAPISARPLTGVRIGMSREFLMSGLDPEVERISNEALGKLRGTGATLVEAELPQPIPTAPQIVGTIGYETMSRVSEFLQEQGTGLSFDRILAEAGESTRARIRSVVFPPGRPSRESYEAMLLQRERLKAALRMHFEEHGLSALAFPAARIPPAKTGEDTEVDISGQNYQWLPRRRGTAR
jgi:indoleacetamide hydrolase